MAISTPRSRLHCVTHSHAHNVIPVMSHCDYPGVETEERSLERPLLAVTGSERVQLQMFGGPESQYMTIITENRSPLFLRQK